MKQALRVLIFLLVINSLILVAVIFPRFTGKVVLEYANVTRVIDGDTLEAGEFKVRLLGINTPERGELGYEEAKAFLMKYEGKEVGLELGKEDKYNRKLAYVYVPELVNQEILKLGLAHVYYYQEDRHTNNLEKAEKLARKQELGIWKKSSNYGCIELVELKYEEEERCNNQEQLVLHNKCQSFSATIKDDATHLYDVELKDIFVMNFSCIWNNNGDSVYIWDDEGLILFYRY